MPLIVSSCAPQEQAGPDGSWPGQRPPPDGPSQGGRRPWIPQMPTYLQGHIKARELNGASGCFSAMLCLTFTCETAQSGVAPSLRSLLFYTGIRGLHLTLLDSYNVHHTGYGCFCYEFPIYIFMITFDSNTVIFKVLWLPAATCGLTEKKGQLQSISGAVNRTHAKRLHCDHIYLSRPW